MKASSQPAEKNLLMQPLPYPRWGLHLLIWLLLCSPAVLGAAAPPPPVPDVEIVLRETQPLTFPRGSRLPLYLWTPNFPATADDAELERVLKALDARGIALFARWGGNDFAKASELPLRVARLQKKLGLETSVDATGLAHGFYNGTPATGHVDKDGKRFFDKSFFWSPGCPFAVQPRYDAMRARLEPWLEKYQQEQLRLDFWAADWEFDGPNEWNHGWAAARQCETCRAKIPNLDTDFPAFQTAVRKVRAEMQREVFVKPIQRRFPNARIGNYAMNPHDGRRYWWDFFEKRTNGLPATAEHGALYRPWAREFEECGYNVAMPVIYTWFNIHGDYAFTNRQYRWCYNLLLEASSTGRHTPPAIPLVTFVHWTTTNPPKELPKDFEALTEANYEELLWHLLLRGHDSFAMWCPAPELAQEVRPVHRVYAAALEYKEFLDHGQPVFFDVPQQPGSVVSALQLGKKLLVRRTDFAPAPAVLELKLATGALLRVPKMDGKCQVLTTP